MLYRRHQPRGWLELGLARGAQCIQTRLKVKYDRAFSFSVFGRLQDELYLLEASGRNRRSEEESETELVFEGTFEHENGCSGNFVVRPRANGELMSLGVYGASQTIKLSTASRHWWKGPVEMSGVANLSLRLDPGLDFSGLVIPNHVVGVLRVQGNEDGGHLPMIAPLTTLCSVTRRY